MDSTFRILSPIFGLMGGLLAIAGQVDVGTFAIVVAIYIRPPESK